MKNLLLALLFLPLTLFAQDSWVRVLLQPDQYAGETSWEIYQDSTLIAVSPPYQSNMFQEVVVPLDSGQYNFVVYDAFGDGICCAFGTGWYGLSNACGLNIFDYEFAGASTTTLFNVEPCAPPVFGCTDPLSLNYHPWANVSEGCAYPPAPCGEGETMIITSLLTDTYAQETSWSITDTAIVASGNGYIEAGLLVSDYTCMTVGDTIQVNVYDTFGDGMCGSCYGGVDGNLLVTNYCGDTLYYVGDTLLFDTISSPSFAIELCEPILPAGCTDPLFVEYDLNAVVDNGGCLTEIVLGCIDEDALNYSPEANIMETGADCFFELTIYDGAGDGWFGSWLGLTQGDSVFSPFQMGPNDGFEETFNLYLNSNEDVKIYFFTEGNSETTSGQCGFKLQGPDSVVIEGGTNPWTDKIKKFPYVYEGTPVCANYCITPVLGCIDINACNYEPLANVDEGCFYSVEYYNCDNICNNDIDNDGVCDELEVVGCMDPTAFNYNALATDPAECEPLIFGCTDPTMYNYDSEANTDANNCISYIDGCTDSSAFNYDPLATAENGSCIEALEGCADPQAYNYEALVNIPDPTSCLYEAVGCVTGLGEPFGDGFWLNDMCFAWVIQVDPYCCEENWDVTCQETFDYCSSTGIEAILAGDDLIVYPNPVSDVLSINKNVDLDVFDSTGRLIISETNTNTIDASLWTPGIYTIRIVWNNRTVIKKIIK